MRYFLLGTGVGLLLSSLLLIFFNASSFEVITHRREGLGIRVVLSGALEEEGIQNHSLALPLLNLPQPLEEKEVLIEEEDRFPGVGIEEEELFEEEVHEEDLAEESLLEEELLYEGTELEDYSLREEEILSKRIFIPYTTPASMIVRILFEAHLIEDEEEFLQDLREAGAIQQLLAGEHFIPEGISHQEMILILTGRKRR